MLMETSIPIETICVDRPLIEIIIIKGESLTTESISHALKDH